MPPLPTTLGVKSQGISSLSPPGQSGGGETPYVPDTDNALGVDANAMNNGIQKSEGPASCHSWGLPAIADLSYVMDTSGMTSNLASLVDSGSYLKSIMPGSLNYCDGNNGRSPAPEPNISGAYAGDSNITSNVVKDTDYTRNPHQWLWKTYQCEDGLFTNGRDGRYLANGGSTSNLSCNNIYTDFPGLSNEFIQDKIIDGGYLDFLLDQKNAERIKEGKNPDTRVITERRKDLTASAFKEDVLKPKNYYNGDWLTYTSEHSKSSAFNMLFEPFYWYRLESYANWHYQYKATTSFTWYEVYNGAEQGNVVIEDVNVGGYWNPSDNVWTKAKEQGVPDYATSNWKILGGVGEATNCKDATGHGGQICDYEQYRMAYTFSWEQHYSAILGPYTKTNSIIDHSSEETTGFEWVDTNYDYEGIASLLENYEEGLCDYIPPEVTAKACRAYYRGDSGISFSDRNTLDKKCACVSLKNLSD